MQALVLAGHSTGCQDAVRYTNRQAEPPDGVILQAPVWFGMAIVLHCDAGYADGTTHWLTTRPQADLSSALPEPRSMPLLRRCR